MTTTVEELIAETLEEQGPTYTVTTPNGDVIEGAGEAYIMDTWPNEGAAMILAAKRAKWRANVVAQYERDVSAAQGHVSDTQLRARDMKRAAAEAHLANIAEPFHTAILEAENGPDGLDDFAQLILEKSVQEHVLIGLAEKVRRETLAAVDACETDEDFAQVVATGRAAVAQALADLEAQTGG